MDLIRTSTRGIEDEKVNNGGLRFMSDRVFVSRKEGGNQHARR